MPEQIKVVIDADGGISVEASGFSGSACEDATAALEVALGIAGDRTPKPEREEAAESVEDWS